MKSLARIAELDGIRGLAIALVLVWHYLASSIDPRVAADGLVVLANVLALTWSGVDLFFVLSGFLIGGILLDNRDSPTYFRTFYVRRIARILPLYFAWFFLFLVIVRLDIFRSIPSLDHLFADPLPVWSYVTFTQNFVMTVSQDFGAEWLGITWSLAIEEQFYLILPLLVYYVAPRRLPYILMTGIALAPLLRIAIIFWVPQFIPGTYVLMPARMDALFLGVLCAYVLREPEAAAALTRRRKQLGAAFIVLGMGVALLTAISTQESFPLVSYGYTWIALFYTSFLLLAVTAAQSWPARMARLPFLRQLGFITYGVYLFHQGINGLFHGLLLQQEPQFHTPVDLGVTLLALAATIGLAYLSWHYFEKWIVRWGHSFQYR